MCNWSFHHAEKCPLIFGHLVAFLIEIRGIDIVKDEQKINVDYYVGNNLEKTKKRLIKQIRMKEPVIGKESRTGRYPATVGDVYRFDVPDNYVSFTVSLIIHHIVHVLPCCLLDDKESLVKNTASPNVLLWSRKSLLFMCCSSVN